MGPFIRWVLQARWRSAISHCIEGLLVPITVTLIT
jgi:hypothetical protein